MKILVTCPPMLGMMDELGATIKKYGGVVTIPRIIQTLSIEELIQLVPNHDGWIIGDDPATREVFEAGKSGKLKAAVKWGIGVDNVDFEACRNLSIPITNTPNMFGQEVADIAIGYLIALARETFQIDQGIRKGEWPKPRGISMAGKTVAVIGYGDIGRNTADRLVAMGMNVIVYDPAVEELSSSMSVSLGKWPDRLGECDFCVITCALTDSSYHLFNEKAFAVMKSGVRLVNVARGPIVDENALVASLKSGQVYSAALDVFEREPLPEGSYLRLHPKCIFGSHNSSNTEDAVRRTSLLAIERLFGFLEEF